MLHYLEPDELAELDRINAAHTANNNRALEILESDAGQDFLQLMISALDAQRFGSLQYSKAAANCREGENELCVLGCIGQYLGLSRDEIYPLDLDALAVAFKIDRIVLEHVLYINDWMSLRHREPNSGRWRQVERFAVRHHRKYMEVNSNMRKRIDWDAIWAEIARQKKALK